MKCPLRKTIIYNPGLHTGDGYPNEWVAYEVFEDCIGRECAAYQTDRVGVTPHVIRYHRCGYLKGEWIKDK